MYGTKYILINFRTVLYTEYSICMKCRIYLRIQNFIQNPKWLINEYDKHRCQKYVELKGQCHEIVIPTIFYIVLSNTYTVCLAKYEKAFNIKKI